MKKHIAEELPARKHAPAAAPAAAGGDKERGGKDEKSPEKRIRQAVYDIRYRARREDVPLRTAFAQYMQNSTLSANERTAVKAKLFGEGPMKTEQFVASARELASESVSNALLKVFAEELAPPKKYKVRVEDKNGKSYVRYADRQKITELRANPNIRSVEITSYGEPYEGERKKGERTAAAKAGKDYDGDGKVESGAKEYRGAVHNAIQRRKGGNPDGQDTSSVKEDFIADGSVHEEKKSKIDILPKDQVNVVKVYNGKNEKSIEEKMDLAKADMGDVVKDFQTSDAPQFRGKSKKKRQQMAIAAKLTAERGGKRLREESHQEEDKKGIVDRFRSKMKEREENSKEEEKNEIEYDTRSTKTSMNLYKNKLRAMGLKMGYEPEGEQIDEMGPLAGLAVRAALGAGTALAGKAVYDKAKGVANKLKQRNQETQKAIDSLRNSYDPEGTTISEREFDEPGEPRGTQYLKVDKKKFDKDMEFWKKQSEKARGTFPVRGA